MMTVFWFLTNMIREICQNLYLKRDIYPPLLPSIQTPCYYMYRQSALPLEKESPHIFTKLNPLDMDTPLIWILSVAPCMSVLLGFDCLSLKLSPEIKIEVSIVLSNSENCEHLKNFRNVDCVLACNHSKVQDRPACKHQNHKLTYHCCLCVSYLTPYWLISCNRVTFHKCFWCSRFCEFHSNVAVLFYGQEMDPVG